MMLIAVNPAINPIILALETISLRFIVLSGSSMAKAHNPPIK